MKEMDCALKKKNYFKNLYQKWDCFRGGMGLGDLVGKSEQGMMTSVYEGVIMKPVILYVN